jgi:hypothetical protein
MVMVECPVAIGRRPRHPHLSTCHQPPTAQPRQSDLLEMWGMGRTNDGPHPSIIPKAMIQSADSKVGDAMPFSTGLAAARTSAVGSVAPIRWRSRYHDVSGMNRYGSEHGTTAKKTRKAAEAVAARGRLHAMGPVSGGVVLCRVRGANSAAPGSLAEQRRQGGVRIPGMEHCAQTDGDGADRN